MSRAPGDWGLAKRLVFAVLTFAIYRGLGLVERTGRRG
jgi:hypothetical protein